MSFVNPERFKSAPVKVEIYFDRETYDKLETSARILGLGSIDRLLKSFADQVIRDLESQGYDLSSNWFKKVVGNEL